MINERLKNLAASLLGLWTALCSVAPAIAGDFLDTERALLKKLASLEMSYGSDSPKLMDNLSELAALYNQHSRFDEYSMIRTRMLNIFLKEHDNHPVPLPGGPFPRIGLKSYSSTKANPPSLLSRWLNQQKLPELYNEEQLPVKKCEENLQHLLHTAEQKTKDSLKTITQLNKLATLYCAMTEFSQAEPLYRQAFSIGKKISNHNRIPSPAVTPGMLDSAALFNIDDFATLLELEGKTSEAKEVKAEAHTLQLQ